mmetsp:Transcript_320/g.686  ORF Transcript_320/g.686 Transcript_320/m.686 type:complete len:135 (-) Transcript_320:187-591(-)
MANALAWVSISLQSPFGMHEARALLLSSGGALRDKRNLDWPSQLLANIAQDDEWNIAARIKMNPVEHGPPIDCEHLRVVFGQCCDEKPEHDSVDIICSVSLHCRLRKVLIVLFEESCSCSDSTQQFGLIMSVID